MGSLQEDGVNLSSTASFSFSSLSGLASSHCRVGEAANPGPGCDMIAMGSTNPSGLSRRVSEVMQLPPGFRSFASQARHLAKEQGRQLRTLRRCCAPSLSGFCCWCLDGCAYYV